MAGRIILPGAVGYHPLQQGDLDDLCGLYAALNAICIVMAPVRPLSDRDVRRLMRAGVRYLDRRYVFRRAFSKGMKVKLQRKLTKHLVQEAGVLTGIPLSARKLRVDPTTSGQVRLIQAIEDSLSQGAAVVMGLQNMHDHFTVVVAVSPTRLYLADSDGLHWLPKRHLGPCGAEPPYRHAVCLKEVLAVGVCR